MFPASHDLDNSLISMHAQAEAKSYATPESEARRETVKKVGHSITFNALSLNQSHVRTVLLLSDDEASVGCLCEGWLG